MTLVQSAYGGAAHLARTLDLDMPSRCVGWTRRDVLIHLGAWDEHRVFERLVEDARHDRVHEIDDPDARNAMIVAAHADAGSDDVARALQRAADRATAFLTSTDAEGLGRRYSESPVGPLPLTGILVASAYEVAIHCLDIAGPDLVPQEVLDAGIAALVDTTGALLARHDMTATFAVRTPTGTWACGSAGGDWTTIRLQSEVDGHHGWPGVHGHASDVLEAAAGRANVTHLLLSRRLRVHDVPALLSLLPALDPVPGLGGSTAAKAALRTLGQTGRVMSRLGWPVWGGAAARR